MVTEMRKIKHPFQERYPCPATSRVLTMAWPVSAAWFKPLSVDEHGGPIRTAPLDLRSSALKAWLLPRLWLLTSPRYGRVQFADPQLGHQTKDTSLTLPSEAIHCCPVELPIG